MPAYRDGALSPRQKRFVEEYLVDLNATRAAIRAGYSRNSASEQACEILANPKIAEAIAKAREELSQRVEITQDMVMREFARIGFSDIRRLMDDGNLRPLSDLTIEEAACISSVEVVTKTLPSSGRDEAPEVEYIHKVRMYDKVAALTQMGRRLGMFVDKSEVSTTVTLRDLVRSAAAARAKSESS